MLNISLIVTTYNRPTTLNLVLQALAAQTQNHFEVIIADDGSTPETATLLQKFYNLPYSLQHVWQEDKGFRAAMARNRAVAVAHSDYLIFLDGDCIPFPDFIARHRQLAEKSCFVVGNRILLKQQFTHHVITQQLPLWSWRLTDWLWSYLRRDVNRLLPLLRLPNLGWRKRYSQTWQGAKTCNLAMWRNDFLQINGFNEAFTGWGHEDAELVVRLLRSGVQRKEGRFAVPVVHLWHPEQNRNQEAVNRQRLEQALHSTATVAQSGVNQYLTGANL